MDTITIQRLNQINQQFYETTAEHFNQTRNQPWSGWELLLSHIQQSRLRVLDVGCGNGRFGLFLADRLRFYHGIDSNPTLLQYAGQALAPLDVTIQLDCQDIIATPPPHGTYDLVALFGVIHHIPGYHNRLDLMKKLAQRVAPGGYLAFAAWRFYEMARFRDRIIAWPSDFRVEPHDYLLDWRSGAHALRYCHFVDDDEHSALVTATELQEITRFRADGKTNDLNQYSLLRSIQ